MVNGGVVNITVTVINIYLVFNIMVDIIVNSISIGTVEISACAVCVMFGYVMVIFTFIKVIFIIVNITVDSIIGINVHSIS